MAALRIFARPCFSPIFTNSLASNISKNTLSNNFKVQERYSSFRSSPKVRDPSNYTDFEVSKDPKEWFFVERVLNQKTVPPAPILTDQKFPSGWQPPAEEAKKLPYFVARSKNHMQPVYLMRTYRGMRRVTRLRKIQGDIWALESELKKYLEEKTGKQIGCQIHEVTGQLNFKGDHVILVKDWLSSKGF